MIQYYCLVFFPFTILQIFPVDTEAEIRPPRHTDALEGNGCDGFTVDQKVAEIVEHGIPLENMKVHPDCQPGVSPSEIMRRESKWGFKILGSFVGSDALNIKNALIVKMEKIHEVATI